MVHRGGIVPVLLSGGAGSRLWPLSRDLYPKQFLPLTSERSMVQETALRVADPGRFTAPLVVCNQEHRFILVEPLRDVGVTPAEVIVEPAGRNTALSIDVAVMERTRRAAVVPAHFEWSDVGTWSSLWNHLEKDGDGNVCQGDVLMQDSHDCVVHSEGKLTTVLGMDDVVVVVTDDAVLIAAKNRAQEVKALRDRLVQARRAEASSHTCVYRPWGHYRTLQMGECFQVKCITVRPGGLLSLQKHYHRAEHWVVVNGTALVTRDSEELLLRENESLYIQLGAVHRLANPGKVPLNLIEVQSGAYLGEDDIVRFEDTYGRS